MTATEHDRWVVFDLIGVLADPSWREITSKENPWPAFRVGEKSEDQFWTTSEGKTYRALLAFRPQRLSIVANLKRRGYRIAIATNFSQAWLDELFTKSPAARGLFDQFVVSSVVHAAKPEPAFWRNVLAFAPRGSLFVDDKLENCKAATQAGLRSVWAHPGVDLNVELANAVEAEQVDA